MVLTMSLKIKEKKIKTRKHETCMMRLKYKKTIIKTKCDRVTEYMMFPPHASINQ